MFLNAFAVVAESDLVSTMPRRLVARFAKPFGLRSFDVPFATTPFGIDLIRARYSLADGAVDWLVRQIGDLLT